MKKKHLFAAAAVVILGAAALWYWTRPAPDTGTIVLYGNVDLRQVALAFNASERIIRLHVQEGDHVTAGQVVGELDSRALALRVAQAQAQAQVYEHALQRMQAGSRPEEIAQASAGVAAAQAQAELAQQQLARLQALRKTTAGQVVSQQDLQNAQAQHKVALAQLENAGKTRQLAVRGPRTEDIAQAGAQLQSARAELDLLNYQLQQAQLQSPIDAVVRARLQEPGDMATPQRPVYALAIVDPKWVRAYVTAADLGHVRPGQAASVTIDSFPDQPMAGRVGYISSVAEFTPKTVQTEELRTSLVYEIRILVQDPNDRLRLGMPATVAIPRQDSPGTAG